MEGKRVLEGWKAISAYLGRTGKTCRKWEQELGLPIHRLDDSASAHVFAYADELNRWREEKLEAERGQPARRPSWFGRKARFWIIACSAVVVVAVIGLLVRPTKPGGKSPGPQTVKSVAVLPFVDLSPNKGQEYPGDGIADILINALNGVEGLRASARTSAFYFKGKDAAPEDIARKLKVEWILEGSVQAHENRLRVVASLLRADDGTTVWTEKYDRNPADIFAVEDEIARSVVDSLKVRIMGDKKAPIIKLGTANLEAYNLYLQGRYLCSKRGFDDLVNAVKYFEKSIELDPRFALGYAGLADVYCVLGGNCCRPAYEAYPKAIAYATKALEIDDQLAEAHSSLAGAKRDYEWDFGGAEREIKRAMEIDPGNGEFHATYALLLRDLGKHEEAIKEINLARDLDPLSLRIRANVGNLLYFARKYSEAEQDLKREIEFEPENCIIYVSLQKVYAAMGRYEEALGYGAPKYSECAFGNQMMDSELINARQAFVYARMGKAEEARKILGGRESISAPGEFISLAYLAATYGWLGEKDKAFRLLGKAYEERDPKMVLLKVDPRFDCLRSDPRFTDLLRRIGLEK
jgi:TolB-like protein/tetratricopeptide (TPR) repeat protein